MFGLGDVLDEIQNIQSVESPIDHSAPWPGTESSTQPATMAGVSVHGHTSLQEPMRSRFRPSPIDAFYTRQRTEGRGIDVEDRKVFQGHGPSPLRASYTAEELVNCSDKNASPGRKSLAAATHAAKKAGKGKEVEDNQGRWRNSADAIDVVARGGLSRRRPAARVLFQEIPAGQQGESSINARQLTRKKKFRRSPNPTTPEFSSLPLSNSSASSSGQSTSHHSRESVTTVTKQSAEEEARPCLIGYPPNFDGASDEPTKPTQAREKPLIKKLADKKPKPSKENKMRAYGPKSISSSGSEVVLFRRGNRPGGNKEHLHNNLKKPAAPATPIQNGPVTPTAVPAPETVRVASIYQQGNGESSKDAEARHSSGAKKRVVSLKKDPYAPAPPEVLEELKRLQRPLLLKAHQDRRRKEIAYLFPSPELLAQARDGPGTDPNSEISKKIETLRQSVQSVAAPGKLLSSLDQKSGKERYCSQWTIYKGTPRVYPAVENGELVLSSTPAPGQEYKEPPPTTHSGLQEQQQIRSEQAAENRWGDAFGADWEYRPRMCSNYAAFRDWFRVWLDTTIMNPCVVDIYHVSFFDGTAHPDGVGSLFIGDFEPGTTIIDPEDEETRLHHHETVAGYAHNFAIHIKKQEDEEEARKKRARSAYIEGMMRAAATPNPHVPRANIYLRPAELGDAPELASLMNWYMEASPLSTDDTIVGQGEVHRRIQSCRSQLLPFIVAVERRTPRTHAHQETISTPETILGYALANDFIGKETSGRYTVNLKVFVRHDSKGKGIGRCLMDKLLEVCDATFRSKRGYYFDKGSEDDMAYYPGGGRRLSRLIFAVSYPDNDRARYEWVMNWLKKYDFEEQGVLKGVAVKSKRHLDVSYLVRNVAFSQGGVFAEG